MKVLTFATPDRRILQYHFRRVPWPRPALQSQFKQYPGEQLRCRHPFWGPALRILGSQRTALFTAMMPEHSMPWLLKVGKHAVRVWRAHSFNRPFPSPCPGSAASSEIPIMNPHSSTSQSCFLKPCTFTRVMSCKGKKPSQGLLGNTNVAPTVDLPTSSRLRSVHQGVSLHPTPIYRGAI